MHGDASTPTTLPTIPSVTTARLLNIFGLELSPEHVEVLSNDLDDNGDGEIDVVGKESTQQVTTKYHNPPTSPPHLSPSPRSSQHITSPLPHPVTPPLAGGAGMGWLVVWGCKLLRSRPRTSQKL